MKQSDVARIIADELDKEAHARIPEQESVMLLALRDVAMRVERRLKNAEESERWG